MNKSISQETWRAMPQDLGHHLIDIQTCLLKASAASDAMIQAHFNGDVAALAQACAIVLSEIMAAANQSVMLGADLGAAQRRSDENNA